MERDHTLVPGITQSPEEGLEPGVARVVVAVGVTALILAILLIGSLLFSLIEAVR